MIESYRFGHVCIDGSEHTANAVDRFNQLTAQGIDAAIAMHLTC